MAQAIRSYFQAAPNQHGERLFAEKSVTFEWFNGTSWQQNQRSSLSMAATIERQDPRTAGNILEVSTRSIEHELGCALSAFNLMLEDESTGQRYPLENWFQSSKYFVGTTPDNRDTIYGPYQALLSVEPKQAKRFLNTHLPAKTAAQYKNNELFQQIQGELSQARFGGFFCKGMLFPTEPKSAFYDWLYIHALMQSHNAEIARQITRYSVFTDIAFNSTKKAPRYNTQARSCAIYVALVQAGLLEQATSSIESFIQTVGY